MWRKWPARNSTLIVSWSQPEWSFLRSQTATTIDRAKLTKRIGTLSIDPLRAIENGLKAAMDLA